MHFAEKSADKGKLDDNEDDYNKNKNKKKQRQQKIVLHARSFSQTFLHDVSPLLASTLLFCGYALLRHLRFFFYSGKGSFRLSGLRQLVA
jgi:hypothetical protein